MSFWIAVGFMVFLLSMLFRNSGDVGDSGTRMTPQELLAAKIQIANRYLNERQKKAALWALLHIAGADGHADQREIETFQFFTQQFGFADTDSLRTELYNTPQSDWIATLSVMSDYNKDWLILFLHEITIADQHISQSEVNLTYKLFTLVGISHQRAVDVIASGAPMSSPSGH